MVACYYSGEGSNCLKSRRSFYAVYISRCILNVRVSVVCIWFTFLYVNILGDEKPSVLMNRSSIVISTVI